MTGSAPRPSDRVTVSRRAKRLTRGLANAVLSVPGLHQLAKLLARRGLLPERIWTGYPLNDVIEIETDSTRFRYEVHTGDYVGMPIYWLGLAGHEGEVLETFGSLAREARVFFDIGANTGIYSLLAASLNPEITVRAFEPAPDSFRQLERNIGLNGLSDRVAPVRAAMSDEVGTAQFYLPEGVFATSASLSSCGMERLDHTVVSVPSDTVDNYCKSHAPPDLLKIDVEGVEDKVLAGMQDCLAHTRPKIILECLADGPTAAIEQILKPAGYRFAHLDGTSLNWRDEIRPVPHTRHRNWLCLHSASQAPA